MAERIVKFRLITYFDEVASQVTPNGDAVLVERIASMGETVDLRPVDEERLDSLGALYSAEEQEAIEAGTYRGADAALLASNRQGVLPSKQILPAEGEGNPSDLDSYKDAIALAEYLQEAKPNVADTLALLPEDATEEQIQKLYDAENIATDNSPRVGVTDELDKRLIDAGGE